MRDRTLLLLLVLVILVVAYGWSVITNLLWALLIAFLALVLLVAFGFWLLRRRARRVLTAWERHMGDTFRTPPPGAPGPGPRGDVIDVEPTDVRDVTPPKPPERPGQGP